MKDCLECKDYRDCEGHNYIIKTEAGEEYVSWYNYEEIRFCPYQIYFIIENEALLGTGRWPDSPESSSSIEPSIKTGYRSEAYYTKPEIILGEFGRFRIKSRVERCLDVCQRVEKKKDEF